MKKIGEISSEEISGMLQNLIVQEATPTKSNYRETLEQKFSIRASVLPKNKNIGAEILENLSLERITQIKNIFDICDIERKGEITLKQVEKCNNGNRESIIYSFF